MNVIHNNHDMLIIEISLSLFSIGASNALHFQEAHRLRFLGGHAVARLNHLVSDRVFCTIRATKLRAKLGPCSFHCGRGNSTPSNRIGRYLVLIEVARHPTRPQRDWARTGAQCASYPRPAGDDAPCGRPAATTLPMDRFLRKPSTEREEAHAL